jgi:hypothetical protein
MKIVAALALALAACSSAPRNPAPPSHTAQPVQPAPAQTAVTFADPAASPGRVTVVARMVALRSEMPLCGILHAGSVVEYEVVTVESGSLAGNHFLAAVGCIQLSRKSYDTGAGTLEAFRVGELHRLVLSTDANDDRGMSVDPSAGPYFIVVSADPA